MNNFIKSRPQRFCLMCGKCCKLSTASIAYKELLALADTGDEGAKDFLNIFEPYSSIDAAKKAHPEIVDNIIKNLKNSTETITEVTFYRCKYILDNNMCGIYENRPELCERFPSSPWAVVPPGCGYEGWLFKCREELKQKIRKQKEILLEFEAELKKEHTPEMKLKLENAIQKIKDIIKIYAKYGAEDW